MEWVGLALLFGGIWYEFIRVGRHVNELRGQCEHLKSEVKELKARIALVERDD